MTTDDVPEPGAAVLVPGTTVDECPRCGAPEAIAHLVVGLLVPPVGMSYDDLVASMRLRRTLAVGCTVNGPTLPAYGCTSCGAEFDADGQRTGPDDETLDARRSARRARPAQPSQPVAPDDGTARRRAGNAVRRVVTRRSTRSRARG